MWHILVRLADGCREIYGDMKELRHLCGHSQPDFGEWVGVAPSMPKKAAWCWEKKWGETSAVPIFHLGSPRKTDPTKCQVSFGKLKKKLFFRGLGGARFPGPSKVANCQQLPLIRQNQAGNAHIDGATPSYLPTSINQPNQHMPHRSEFTRKDIRVVPGQEAKPSGTTSELSQDRRQNDQARHQSCPFWDIDGATASCLGITLIDVAYFG